jgi:hypothetical protein
MLRTLPASLFASSLVLAAALGASPARAQTTDAPPSGGAPPGETRPEAPPTAAPATEAPPPAVPAAPAPAAAAVAAPATPPPASPETPFGFGDFTWMNGQSRQKDFPLKAFGDAVTLSLYLDVNYGYSANHPRDDTLTGTASVTRHNEFNVNLASIGMEWSYRNVIGRLSLQYGSMISVVQDVDGTTARGRNNAVQNLRYIREATAGYHFDALKGINVEGGIFMSYVGLESYLQAENWNYTRSVVCEHTPFYFQGMRVQIFPSDRVKIEPWLMNGWQTYGKWNLAPAGGVALRWSPTEALTLLANFYVGSDTKGEGDRVRFHNDHSILLRYFNEPTSGFISKAAISLNNHIGFEAGGHDPTTGAALPGPDHAHMVGASLVNRVWFSHDHLAVAMRPEVFSNPSRYLSEYPPPGFETGPQVRALQIWGFTTTFDVMPTDFFAFRLEGSYRHANVPYYAGPGGTTSPDGYQPTPAGYVPDVVQDQALAVASVNFRL